MTVAITACVKCEERYIREWIGHHLNLGFDHLFLADNNDMDYKPTLESVIRDYVDQGKVTIVDCKGMNPVQPKCYNMIMDLYGNDYDWYAMIDVDEFFCLPKHGNIKAFLKSVPQDTDIVYIHWRLYGDNGLLTYDDRPVQERFQEAANNDHINKGYSKYVKSIFRNKDWFEQKNGAPFVINNLHCVVNETGVDRKNCLGATCGEQRISYTYDFKEEEFDVAYIKHFATKSTEEYIKNKVIRGCAYMHGNGRYTTGYYFFHNERTRKKIEMFNKYGITIV